MMMQNSLIGSKRTGGSCSTLRHQGKSRAFVHFLTRSKARCCGGSPSVPLLPALDFSVSFLKKKLLKK